jgi:type I restriction enzyme S subunit
MSAFASSPWALVKLRTICGDKETCDPSANPESEFEYIDIASVCNEKFEVMDPKRLAGSEAPSRARKRIRTGDVLVSTTRPYLKSIAKIPARLDGQVCSTGFCVLRPTAKVLPDWIFFAALAGDFTQQLTSQMRGANYPAVTDRDVLDAVIPLPDINAQRSIIARIKECTERVKEVEVNATTVARELDALFPAVLNQRFSEISKIYGARQLEDVADIRGGGSLLKGSTTDGGHASVLLVKVGDMNAVGNERVVNTAREFLPLTKVGRGIIEAGAVIFPKRGGAIATNKKRLLGRPALIDPNLMAVVAKPEVMSPDYLYYWCQALDLSKLSNGGVIPQLNRKDLAPLEIPVPDIKAQAQIVDELQRVEGYCAQLRIEFVDAQTERAGLREAILRKAFAGEL